MSIQRQFRRTAARRAGKDWPGSETPFRHDSGGYSALHPTKGWRRVSNARLRAQFRLREMIERIDRKMGRVAQ